MASFSSEMSGGMLSQGAKPAPERRNGEGDRRWYAVYTLPQNERSVGKHLDARKIELFFPASEGRRVWRNRQRVKVFQALFPTYLFVRIQPLARSRTFQSPGVLGIVGHSQGSLPLPDEEIKFRRSDSRRKRVEPYREFVIGQKVRIRHGTMQGVQDALIRKKSRPGYALTLDAIHQHAALEVAAEELKSVRG